MTRTGFQITRLTLKGAGVKDASVDFGPGLNVISGPSDTGKTFICECIDYAFGASTKPSNIPESQRYESVVLDITATATGIPYSVERSLRGGGAVIATPGQPDRVVAEKHQPGNDDTISHFLLSMCGLSGRLVRTNSDGKTRQISFRDVAHVIVVGEEEIIRKRSPIHSGQRTSRTVEDSVFRLLLTGVDDASVIAAPDRALVTAEGRAKGELLDVLVEQSRAELAQSALGADRVELTGRLERIEATIVKVMASVASEQRAASNLEEQRRVMWTELTGNQSRLAVLSELHERFSLLKAQYASDLRRLESIAEAGIRLSQLDQVRCPICGAEAKYHTQHHPDHAVSPNVVAEACGAEANRLKSLLADLDQTITHSSNELAELRETIAAQKHHLEGINGELANHFRPRLRETVVRLQEARELQAKLRRALDVLARIDYFNTLREQVGSMMMASPKSKFVATAGSSETEVFSLKVEELLRAWQFPDLQRVTFDDADQDILISGRKRSDHGKGVRAITHAAFTIGLMYYCIDKGMPHPGVVVVDSPLVVYREPDKDEAGFSRALKDLAYSSLAAQVNRGQIILLENEDPPANMPDSPTAIRFTGASHGRWGFIPPVPPVISREGDQ